MTDDVPNTEVEITYDGDNKTGLVKINSETILGVTNVSTQMYVDGCTTVPMVSITLIPRKLLVKLGHADTHGLLAHDDERDYKALMRKLYAKIESQSKIIYDYKSSVEQSSLLRRLLGWLIRKD